MHPKKNRVVVSQTIHPEDRDKLDLIAKHRGITRSDLLNEVLYSSGVLKDYESIIQRATFFSTSEIKHKGRKGGPPEQTSLGFEE